MAIESYKTNKGVRYKATLWKKRKRQASRSFQKKRDAEEWLRREELKIDDRKVGRLLGTNMTFEEFAEGIYWKCTDIRENTAEDYRCILNHHILPLVGKKNLVELSEDEWEEVLRQCKKKGQSNSRVNRVHAVASAVYAVAVKKRYVQSNPLTMIDYLETTISDFDYWNEEEVQQFLDFCRITSHPRYSLYWLAYETGMRISELIALRWDAVDFINGVITVRRSYSKHLRTIQETTKNGRLRRLGINSNIVNALRIASENKLSEFVFCRGHGAHLRYDSLYDQFKADQKKAHVRQIGIHDIRHTYASHYVMRGGTIYDLKDLLGHADIGTTERYAHLSPSHLVKKASIVSYVPSVISNVVPLSSPKSS